MDKSELVEALRETGIVPKENDANGVRVLLTVNDYETLGSKRDQAALDSKLKNAQFAAIIITSFCLIATTLYSVSPPTGGDTEYIPRSGYILKLSNGGREFCFIPEVPENQTQRIKQLTGLQQC